MRLFSVLLLVALPLSAYLATIGNVDLLNNQQLELEELSRLLHVGSDARSLNLIWTMLPLYGWIKLRSFLDRSALEKVYVRLFYKLIKNSLLIKSCFRASSRNIHNTIKLSRPS